MATVFLNVLSEKHPKNKLKQNNFLKFYIMMFYGIGCLPLDYFQLYSVNTRNLSYSWLSRKVTALFNQTLQLNGGAWRPWFAIGAIIKEFILFLRIFLRNIRNSWPYSLTINLVKYPNKKLLLFFFRLLLMSNYFIFDTKFIKLTICFFSSVYNYR